MALHAYFNAFSFLQVLAIESCVMGEAGDEYSRAGYEGWKVWSSVFLNMKCKCPKSRKRAQNINVRPSLHSPN
jgi:hypothetical protein